MKNIKRNHGHKSALIRRYLAKGITSPSKIVALLQEKHDVSISANLVHVVKKAQEGGETAPVTKVSAKLTRVKPANDVKRLLADAIEVHGLSNVTSALTLLTERVRQVA